MSIHMLPFILTLIVLAAFIVQQVRHRRAMRVLDAEFADVVEAVVYIKSLTWHERQALRQSFPDSSDLIRNIDRAKEVVASYRETHPRD